MSRRHLAAAASKLHARAAPSPCGKTAPLPLPHLVRQSPRRALPSLGSAFPAHQAFQAAPKTTTTTPRQIRLFSTAPDISSIETVPLAFEHHEPPARKDGEEEGGAPIIFLHGLFGSKKNNRSVSRVLARDLQRHVYTVDLRNHGDSPHSPRHDYPSMAADISRFIADHSLPSPVLIGHSMGAKAAMTLALTSPRLVSALIAVDNAPVDAQLESSFSKYLAGMQVIEKAGVSRQSEADALLAPYEAALPVRQFLLGNLIRDPSSSSDDKKKTLKFQIPLDVLARTLAHNGDFPFHDPDATRFEGPALFVRGTRSKYVADEAIPVIGRFFPRFRLVDVDAGHWLISEKPAEFIQAVTEFLRPDDE